MPTSAIGTVRITAAGWLQLSYRPARTRKTSVMERPKMKYDWFPTSCSW
jgi:hypothetical protein